MKTSCCDLRSLVAAVILFGNECSFYQINQKLTDMLSDDQNIHMIIQLLEEERVGTIIDIHTNH
jgi:hypothetical protein